MLIKILTWGINLLMYFIPLNCLETDFLYYYQLQSCHSHQLSIIQSLLPAISEILLVSHTSPNVTNFGFTALKTTILFSKQNTVSNSYIQSQEESRFSTDRSKREKCSTQLHNQSLLVQRFDIRDLRSQIPDWTHEITYWYLPNPSRMISFLQAEVGFLQISDSHCYGLGRL